MENKLFRKSALERVTSPEQLNEYMRVAGPGVWAVLAGLVLTFAAFIVWGFMGSVPETVHFQGTFLRDEEGVLAVYSYLSIDETRRLNAGMDVRVSPTFAPDDHFGYIFGTISYVGYAPVSAEVLEQILGGYFAMLNLPPGNLIQVVVEIEMADGRPRWSTPRGDDVDVPVGSFSDLVAVTRERRPVELMFR